jgi:hypothetical protein
VDLESVIVLSDAGVIAGCRPNEPGEIARAEAISSGIVERIEAEARA